LSDIQRRDLHIYQIVPNPLFTEQDLLLSDLPWEDVWCGTSRNNDRFLITQDRESLSAEEEARVAGGQYASGGRDNWPDVVGDWCHECLKVGESVALGFGNMVRVS